VERRRLANRERRTAARRVEHQDGLETTAHVGFQRLTDERRMAGGERGQIVDHERSGRPSFERDQAGLR